MVWACQLLGPTYRSIAIKTEDCDALLQFLAADVRVVPDLGHYENSCKPVFVFFLGSKYVGEVSGLNIPKIKQKINRYMSSLDKD
jgi:hypothetical protein